MELTKVMSSNDFLYASIHEVVKTLFEAVFLVILIVYVFLQDIRSTVIPLVGIIVSLIGTFAFMSLAGFSINLITLFALVLVIGTVVDDAIVVVEAVQARFDVGYRSSYMASIDAMKGISNAVISSSLVFMAVFIPVSFMSGTSGTFYTQIWSDYGGGCRYLSCQCIDIESGIVCFVPETVYQRRWYRGKTILQRVFVKRQCGLRCND